MAGDGGVAEPAPALAHVLAELFPDLTTLYRYVDLLTDDGVRRGLLGPREVAAIYPRHILNCAVIAPAISQGARVCDVGSGAGLPGLVLALARPDLRVTLLEPMQRRVAFLREAVDILELEGVTVLRDRAGTLSDDFNVVTARAVAPLSRLVEWTVPLLRPGGELLALKGDRAAAELAEAADVFRRLRVGEPSIERFGEGIVEPLTTVVRLTVVG